MRSKALSHMQAQGLSQLRIAQKVRTEHHKGFDQFSALGIGLADYGGFNHGRVFDQGTFHVEWPHAITRGGNHIITAPDETDTAIGVQLDRVTAQVIVADKGFGGEPVIAAKPAHG